MSIATQAEERPRAIGRGSFLKRVKIRNYKSIASCDVVLKPFTLLVGRNGSGKSNFLDAIRLVADGLREPLFPHVIGVRGGIGNVIRVGADSFAIDLELELPSGDVAAFGFEVGRLGGSWGFGLKAESLVVQNFRDEQTYEYRVAGGEVATNLEYRMPPAASDRLYLVSASSYPEFRPAFDALASMGFYNPNPAAMRGYQAPQAGVSLESDGRNLANALATVDVQQPLAGERIVDYLRVIVPEIRALESVTSGPVQILKFSYKGIPTEREYFLDARTASDGTLRALGILVAINQLADDGSPIRLVGIEEPETALHPAASGALMDALREAATHTQILVTTHGGDLLDIYDPEEDHLLVVRFREGKTQIGEVDGVGRKMIRKHLFTAGELLRIDQLDPDRSSLDPAATPG